MNLLLFKVSTLGENLAFIPVVQELRRRFPEAQLTLFTGHDCGPLYQGTLAPQKIHTLDRAAFNASWTNPISFLKHWGRARLARANACLLAGDQGTVAHLLAFLTAHPPHIGSAELKLRLPLKVTNPVHFPPGARIAHWHWEMGRALSVELGRYDWPMAMPAPDLSHLITPRAKNRPVVVIDAGARHDYKRWSLDHYLRLAQNFARDCEVVWIESWSSPAQHLPAEARVVSISDLPELTSWMAAADLFIGNHVDTVQLASAVGCPGIILAGPTNPEWDPVWHAERFQILRATDLPCLPCETHELKPGICTYQADPQACLLHWSLENVERRAREWLAKMSTLKR